MSVVRAKKTNRHSPGSGGHRTATPGAQYPQRTDLAQPIRVPTGQPYGARQAAVQSQQANPLPQVPQPRPVQARPMTGPPQEPPTPLDAPTQNPNEHVMTGSPLGPGAGPQDIGMGQGDQVVDLLSAAYRAMPTEELRGMLEEAQIRFNDG